MFPHLIVRPLVIDPAIIKSLRGAKGYRPAATISFSDTRQSKRSLAQQFDNAKRRWEDWEKKHASAEPVLVGGFPAYGANTTRSYPLNGALQPGQEVRELQVIVSGTLNINAATGQVQAADHNVLATALFTKIRASLYGIADAYNLSSAESRTIAFIADSRDSFTQDPGLRIGAPMTTTPAKVKLKFKIPFVVRSLEVPENFSPTTDQIMLPGSKIDLDTNGSALTTLAFVSGASTFVVNDVALYVIVNAIPILHAGPPHLWRSFQMAQSTYSESGQAVQIFLGAEEAATATGSGARIQQYTVRRDGRPQPNNIDPVTLAQQYNETNFSVDALGPLDITNGSIPRSGVATAAQPVPDGNIGTQAGAQNVPLVWNDGKVRAGAWQWAFFKSSLAVQQNLIAGQSAVVNLLSWQIRTIYECAGQVVSLAAQNGLAISSIDDLKTRGGNDGEINMEFKGRFMEKKPPIQRAA